MPLVPGQCQSALRAQKSGGDLPPRVRHQAMNYLSFLNFQKILRRNGLGSTSGTPASRAERRSPHPIQNGTIVPPISTIPATGDGGSPVSGDNTSEYASSPVPAPPGVRTPPPLKKSSA